MDHAADHQLAHDLATAAGRLLLSVRTEFGAPADAEPTPESQALLAERLRTEGDRQANSFLMEALRAARPNDPVLSEEEREDPGNVATRLSSSRAWIIDPLDGTREYSEPPRTDWAVHVALCIDGVPVAGAVALPAQGVTFSTVAPPIVPPVTGVPRIIVSRTRPPAEALTVNTALGGTLVEMGSAGAKAMAILQGTADVYPHSGGQFEWDSCAPVAVAMASGLWCSRLDGSPLRYNNADPYLPDLLICRPELAASVLRAANSTP